MTDQVATGAMAGPASSNVFARLAGVIFSPRETFAALVPRPRWLGALAVVTLLTAGSQYAFLSTEIGQQAMVDQQIHQAELRGGGSITQQQIDMFESLKTKNRYIVGGSILIIGPIMTFLFAGIYFGVFNAMLGGDATYKQVLAIVTHSGAVNLVQMLFVVPLNYVRESASSATNLGVFVQSFLDETNFVARVLGMIDLFIIWNLLITAIGLGVLYRRKTGPIFWSLMGAYVVIVLVIAGVMRAFGGA
jgi:Yip1-like protein